MSKYHPIDGYGIIGDLHSCALVSPEASIDWLCLPHIESESVFAAILDVSQGGHFHVKPIGKFETSSRYMGDTNILETTLTTSTGAIMVRDLMPVLSEDEEATGTHRVRGEGMPVMIRRVKCHKGEVTVEVEFAPRFDYSRVNTLVASVEGGALGSWEDRRLFLQSPVDLSVDDKGVARGTKVLSEGDEIWLALHHDQKNPISTEDCRDLYVCTKRFWRQWAHRCEPVCTFDGPWHAQVSRSSLLLKLLTHKETGAIAAAPTTSLPEEIGGERNWDYRYAWVRDSSFTVQALYNLGHVQEGLDYLRWLRDLCHQSDPSAISVLYGLHGDVPTSEEELDHLEGYRGSKPVRIGNGAVDQVQLDIYGELINAYYETSRYGLALEPEDRVFIERIADYVTDHWMDTDLGIWEVRSEPLHFTYSKLMCWVALDRAVKIAGDAVEVDRVERWGQERDRIHAAVIEKSFDPAMNSFTQSFESKALDAATLLIPMMGFLPVDDPRVVGTIEAIEKHLTRDGFVMRYQSEDGLPGDEGAFLLCTFWLVDVLALSGQIEKAEKLFSYVLSHASPLGLFGEEIDPKTKEHLGNYPQAFSHIGLINSALYLGRARGRPQMGPEPSGA